MRLLPDHYDAENVRRGFSNPKLLLDELARAYTAVSFSRSYGEGVDVMAEEWENLLLLDACRYDAFERVNRIDGRLESRISPASESETFIAETFLGRELHDTVYVTANAYASTIGDDVFHAVEPVELRPIGECPRYEGFDELPEDSYGALPEDVADAAREAQERFPEKRLIVHFMQPHIPFLGPTGLEIYRELLGDDPGMRPDGTRVRWGALGNKPYHYVEDPAYDFTRSDVRTAYRENLELVLEDVEALLRDLRGRTVVSADHGEMLGERLYPYGNRWYGHPSMLTTAQLRKVPWFRPDVETEPKTVTADPPVDSERMAEADVEEKLRVLGYL